MEDAKDGQAIVNGRRIPQKGERMAWRTVGGDEYSGEVVDVDSNVLYVRCGDGVVRCVEG